MKYLTSLMIAYFLTTNAFAQSSADELVSGGAAVVVISQKCNPNKEREVESYVLNELNRRLSNFSSEEKANHIENFEMKKKAFQISASSDSCQNLERLKSMAYHWGFSALL